MCFHEDKQWISNTCTQQKMSNKSLRSNSLRLRESLIPLLLQFTRLLHTELMISCHFDNYTLEKKKKNSEKVKVTLQWCWIFDRYDLPWRHTMYALHTHIELILNSRWILDFSLQRPGPPCLPSQPTQSWWPPSLDSQYTYSTDIELQHDWQAAYQGVCLS